MLTYVLWSGVCLMVLCMAFMVLMYRDTHVAARRAVLLCIYVCSLLLPACDMQAWMGGSGATAGLVEGYGAYVLPALDVTAQRMVWLGLMPSEAGCAPWVPAARQLWALVAAVPALWLACRLAVQVARVVRMAVTCCRAEVCGQRVCLLTDGGAPFSFGPWIFVDPRGMNAATLREVIVHESAHVRQWHTADTLVAELFCIAFWWNPAAWVLRREVRLNLEFLADRAVADSFATGSTPAVEGVRAAGLRAYQYHLLAFTIQHRVATIANNLNVSPLKRRIAMMNSKHSPWRSRAASLLFLPAVAALLLLSNIDALARHRHDAASEPAGHVLPAVQVTAYADSICSHPEVLPEYGGGAGELMQELMRTMRYPQAAIDAGVQGRAMVGFVVERDGTLTHVELLQLKDASGARLEAQDMAAGMTDVQRAQAAARNAGIAALRDESCRVVRALPARWTPGTMNGQPVRTRFVLPIVFRLN